MKNQNDFTSTFYDLAYSQIKGENITGDEISLIKKIVHKKAKILDIGCGTGRHFVKLINEDFDVYGVDSSEGMISQLKNKISPKNHKKIFNIDFLDTKLNIKDFDLIILFWNSFNEICLTKKQAKKFFRTAKKLLKKNGKVLINIDDVKKITPQNFNFFNEFFIEGLFIETSFKTIKFDKRTRTSISEETIIVNKKKFYKSIIKQRWWSISEIKKIASNFSKFKLLSVDNNNEVYVLISDA